MANVARMVRSNDSRNVLVVEQDEGIVRTVSARLRSRFRVTVASSARAARELATTYEFPIVLVGARLDDHGSLELAAWLKHRDPGTFVALVGEVEDPEELVTASSLDIQIADWQEIGEANDFLVALAARPRAKRISGAG